MRRIRCPRCRKTVVIADGRQSPLVDCTTCKVRIRIPEQQGSGSGMIRPVAPAQMMAGAAGRPAAPAAVRLRCIKCETVFPSTAKPGITVSCPKCGASIRPNTPPPTARNEPPKRTKGTAVGTVKVGGRKRDSSIPGRSDLNPMTESFLDSMEVLNRSAVGMEMLAPNANGGGRLAQAARSLNGSARSGGFLPGSAGTLPAAAQWVILALVIGLAAVGAVASFKWIMGP